MLMGYCYAFCLQIKLLTCIMQYQNPISLSYIKLLENNYVYSCTLYQHYAKTSKLLFVLILKVMLIFYKVYLVKNSYQTFKYSLSDEHPQRIYQRYVNTWLVLIVILLLVWFLYVLSFHSLILQMLWMERLM